MNNLPVNPLQGILSRAARTLPATTGKVAVQQARLDRRRGTSVILADISASMGSPAWGGRRKIDVLREAVDGALSHQKDAKLFVFSTNIRECSAIPEPEHNTNLAAALREVCKLDPGITLVISDGQPDNEKLALDAARNFRGVIDVLYIGPESNHGAIEFMKRLAGVAGGELRTHDVARLGNAQQLLGHIAGLLR